MPDRTVKGASLMSYKLVRVGASVDMALKVCSDLPPECEQYNHKGLRHIVLIIGPMVGNVDNG